jgi:hypothetical protein
VLGRLRICPIMVRIVVVALLKHPGRFSHADMGLCDEPHHAYDVLLFSVRQRGSRYRTVALPSFENNNLNISFCAIEKRGDIGHLARS